MRRSALLSALLPLFLSACPGEEPREGEGEGDGEGEGEGEGERECPDDQLRCDALCVDPLTDNAHCGATQDCAGENTGVACGDGTVCSGGACLPTCAEPFSTCGDRCADLDSDEEHCGACGTACGEGESCSDGTCCTTGLLGCDGACVNAASDDQNCGGCGVVCGLQRSCIDAQCQCANEALTPCGIGCVDTLTDDDHCGGCGISCGSAAECIAGECVERAVEACEGALLDDDGDGAVNCQDDDCAASCTSGEALTGAPCAVNADCSSDASDGVCLNESLFGFRGGACSEWCDPSGAPCSGDGACIPLVVGSGPQTGLCIDACDTNDDCREGYECIDAFGFGVASCYPVSVCGDDVAGPFEECDGDALRERSCATFGLSDSGGLGCSAECALDFSGCAAVCGDGLVAWQSDVEACDGTTVPCTDIQGGTGDGVAGCRDDCMGYDVSACEGTVCGNGVGEPDNGEACDGDDVMGLSCASLGYNGGVLACDSFCALDTSACAAVCGDGTLAPDEECDDGNTDPGDGCGASCLVEVSEVESNDTPETANPYRATFVGQISPNADRDCMQIGATEGELIVGDMVNVQSGALQGCGVDPTLQLFDPSGAEAAFNDDFGGSLCSHIEHVAAATGAWVLCVQSYGNNSSFVYRLDAHTQAYACPTDVCPDGAGGEVCTDLDTDPNHCGACDAQCADGGACVEGICECPYFQPEVCTDGVGGSFCVDMSFDEQNCGACGITCGLSEECWGGVCRCPRGLPDQCPDGAGGELCTNLDFDAENCGGCGIACPDGQGCGAGTCADVVAFVGVQRDVPRANLAGWSECYSDTYNDVRSLDEMLGACPGSSLMLACQDPGSPDTLALLAHAPRADVLFATGASYDATHAANGVAWYFDPSYSWGFAPEGAPVNLGSCDTADESSDERLCWHTGNGELQPGYRCGAAHEGFYRRLVFTADF